MQDEGVTRLLVRWGDGDRAALEEMLPLVLGELRRIAQARLRRERADHTLQPTALVNEAFLRLVDQRGVRWQNRAHFFGVAAQMMRRILSNYARDQRRLRRGGGAIQVSLSEAAPVSHVRLEEVLAMDEALERLAEFDGQMSRMIELRYVGGLSVKETAEVMRVSVATVNRDCKFACAWLERAMKPRAPEGRGPDDDE